MKKLKTKTAARLAPAQQMTSRELGDLHGKLDDKTANALANSIKQTRKGAGGRLQSLRNPWVS